MGLIKSIKDAVTGKNIDEERQDPSEPFIDALISYTSDNSGTYVGFGALRNSDIFSAVRKIASDVSDTKLQYTGSSDHDRILNLVNRQPNPDMNSWTFWFSIMVCALLNGNSFAKIERNNSGQVNALYFMPNNETVVKEGEKTGHLTYYWKGKKLNSSEVLHFKVFANGKTGVSPLYALQNQMQIQQSKNNLLNDFFKHGLFGNAILKVNDGLLSPKALRNIRAKYLEANSKPNGAIVLDSQMDFKTLPINSDVMNIANEVNWTTRQIASCFGLPPEVLGVENEHSSNTQSMLQYLQGTLTAYFSAITSELDSKLASQNSHFSFDTTSLFTADPTVNYQLYEQAVQSKILTPNEARNKLGLPPVQGGDKLLDNNEGVETNE